MNLDSEGVKQPVTEILEKLEPDERELISTMFSYSGPLPPPEYLEGYSQVYPDAPQKIFTWVEDQQNHRHQMDKTIVDKTFKQSMTGIILGFLIVAMFIIFGFILILLDKEVAGFLLLLPAISVVAGYLILQNRSATSSDEDDANEEK